MKVEHKSAFESSKEADVKAADVALDGDLKEQSLEDAIKSLSESPHDAPITAALLGRLLHTSYNTDRYAITMDNPGWVHTGLHDLAKKLSHRFYIKITNESDTNVVACVTQTVVQQTEITKAIKAALTVVPSGGGSLDLSSAIKQAFKDRISSFPVYARQHKLKASTSNGLLCYVTVILAKSDPTLTHIAYVCDDFAVPDDATLTIEQADIDNINSTGAWIPIIHQAKKPP